VRSPDELRFILARVLAEIRANPPGGPLLTERGLRHHRTTCLRGHDKEGRRDCPTCERDRKRRRRVEGVEW
jgi:hypothetical protein